MADGRLGADPEVIDPVAIQRQHAGSHYCGGYLWQAHKGDCLPKRLANALVHERSLR